MSPSPSEKAQAVLKAPIAQLAMGTKTLAERKRWSRPATLCRLTAGLALGLSASAWLLFPAPVQQQLEHWRQEAAKAWLSNPAFSGQAALPHPEVTLPAEALNGWMEAMVRTVRSSPARACVPAAQRIANDPVPRNEQGCPLIAPEAVSWVPARFF